MVPIWLPMFPVPMSTRLSVFRENVCPCNQLLNNIKTITIRRVGSPFNITTSYSLASWTKVIPTTNELQTYSEWWSVQDEDLLVWSVPADPWRTPSATLRRHGPRSPWSTWSGRPGQSHPWAGKNGCSFSYDCSDSLDRLCPNISILFC